MCFVQAKCLTRALHSVREAGSREKLYLNHYQDFVWTWSRPTNVTDLLRKEGRREEEREKGGREREKGEREKEKRGREGEGREREGEGRKREGEERERGRGEGERREGRVKGGREKGESKLVT